MALSTVEYLLIDGRRYLWEPRTLKRFSQPVEVSQLKAKRLQSPFVDGEVTGFERGISPEALDDEATYYRDALGLEPTGSDLTIFRHLRCGRTLDVSLSEAGAGAIRPLLAFRGNLYAGEQNSDNVLKFDGTSWSVAQDLGSRTGGIRALAEFKGKLYVSNGSDGQVASTPDGTTWTNPQFTVTGATGIFAMAVLYVSGQPRLYIVADEVLNVTTAARVYYWDGSTLSAEQFAFEERWSRGGAVVLNNVLYFGASDAIDRFQSQMRSSIYSFNGSTWSRVARIDANFPTVAAAFNGKTYWGMVKRGELYELDGTALKLVRDFNTTKPLLGLYVFQGALWVSVYNDTANRLELHRYDGQGWSLPHYVSATNDEAGEIAAYQDRLFVGSGSGTTRRVYVVSNTNRVTAAQLEAPDVVYGMPSLPKRYRRVTLQHSPLLSGQAVEMRYRLDDGSEVSAGVNRDVGSTATVFELGDGVRGYRLRPKWYITNGAAQDFTAYSASVRAIPAPPEQEVLAADLQLSNFMGAWQDGVPDTDDALTKFERLRALKRTNQPFQVVDPFRDGATIKRAFLALFDPQVPLEWKLEPLGTLQLVVPVRLLQAGEPQNFLKNASFERDAVGSPPSDWFENGAGISSNVADPTTFALPADGDKALKIVFGGGGSFYGRGQSVSGVTPGRWYTLSVYLYRKMTVGTVRVSVSGAGIDVNKASITLPGVTDSGINFIRYSVTFERTGTLVGTVTVLIEGLDTPAGELWADAVMLEQGAPASTFKELGSGG